MSAVGGNLFVVLSGVKQAVNFTGDKSKISTKVPSARVTVVTTVNRSKSFGFHFRHRGIEREKRELL